MLHSDMDPDTVLVGILDVARQMWEAGARPRFVVLPRRAAISLRNELLARMIQTGADVAEPAMLTEIVTEWGSLEVLVSPLCPPGSVYVLQDDPRPLEENWWATYK